MGWVCRARLRADRPTSRHSRTGRVRRASEQHARSSWFSSRLLPEASLAPDPRFCSLFDLHFEGVEAAEQIIRPAQITNLPESRSLSFPSRWSGGTGGGGERPR